MSENFQNKKTLRPPEIYKLISSIRDVTKRNLLRGLIAKHRLSNQDVEAIRKANSLHDSVIVGALLKGENGLLHSSNAMKRRSSNDLFTMTGFPSIDWQKEICYTVGYINSVSEAAVGLLGIIESLSHLEAMETKDILQILLDLSKEHGASNYLSYKLAYIRSARDLPEDLLDVVSQIETEICHRDNPGLHFSALENLSCKISLFVVAQRRVSGLVGKVEGNFRKAISLNNFIPTPLDEDDVAKLLLRATESSLIDTVYSILIIFNLSQEFESIQKELINRLNEGFITKLLNVKRTVADIEDGMIITPYYESQNKDSDPSLNLYRISSAFLERPKFAIYRNSIDRVVGVRLLAEIIGDAGNRFLPSICDKKSLLAQNKTRIPKNDLILADSFYRTFLFLTFIANKSNLLCLSKNEMKFVFENTLGLEMLLTGQEMEMLYTTARPEAKGLIAVLALALFQEKSIDPDVEFSFRTEFMSYVKTAHNGSIVDFINNLLNDSPQIANYIVGTLDEVKLEKMYDLVTSVSQASEIRCEILRAVGHKLGRIEYFVEADLITTRSKLSGLQKYFDSSRMYIDNISMKKWLDNNPTVSTEQFRAVYIRQESRQTAAIEGKQNQLDGTDLYLSDKSDYLVNQIAIDAFEQFCLNVEFGIQSYLGRRIRHNTLDGVTTNTVDAVLCKPEYRVLLSNSNMRRITEDWLQSYKSIIDKLARENLQFKSNKSLFKATLNLEDGITKDNIKKLSNALRVSGQGELLNDLIIAFCWRQITPQLENAARFIKTKLLNEANHSIERHFLGNYGTVEAQMKTDIQEAVNDVFKKVADWFQVPQAGFISATVKDLCQIILIELDKVNRVQFTGEDGDIKYTGISVHRMYDCLAILLKNAFKHGAADKPVFIDVSSRLASIDSSFDVVSINVKSIANGEDYLLSKQRIFTAIDSAENSTDMVTEGYTGIKKIKFITRSSEGAHTVLCIAKDEKCEFNINFHLHMETAIEDDASDLII